VKVLFVAHEVGSVRALVPVCHCCADRGIPFHVVDIGHFANLQNREIRQAAVTLPADLSQIDAWLQQLSITVMIFSVNSRNTLPLMLARRASAINLPTLHVLDFWNGYRSRMILDGGALFVPSVYAVADQFAVTMAVAEGIDRAIIEITGQPAFHDAEDRYQDAVNQPSQAVQSLLQHQIQARTLILFVSEPEQGHAAGSGSAIRAAMLVLLQALQQHPAGQSFYVCALPHPQEDRDQFTTLWRELGGEAFGCVVSDIRGRDLLPHVAGVVGLSSTLLYEAWLVGVPVLGLRPGSGNNVLWMTQCTDNMVLVHHLDGVIERVCAWLSEGVAGTHQSQVKQDLMRHRAAPENIVNRIGALVAQ